MKIRLAKMTSYFRLVPNPLTPGDIIEPGNFGNLIRAEGEQHQLYRREMTYEAVRATYFPDRPSRLECLFCFPTVEEAELCRTHIHGFADSILYEVESHEADPHVADMNNALQHFSLPVFDLNIIAYYWQGWNPSPDPNALVLREVLLRHPVIVIRKI